MSEPTLVNRPHYLSISGVGRLLKISRQAVWQAYTHGGKLPEPAATVDGRPVWLAEQFKGAA